MPRSPLNAKLETTPAQRIDYHGWEIPAIFHSLEAEYQALKTGAGLLDLSCRGHLLVRGKDAPRFLHGMVTNDVQGLVPGHGNEAFLLNVHGHTLALLNVLRLEPETFLLDFEPQLGEVIFQALDRHIIADRVELEVCGPEGGQSLGCFGLEGPRAGDVLRHVIGIDLAEMNFLEHRYFENLSLRVVRASHSRGHGYWMLAELDRVVELWNAILDADLSRRGTTGGAPDGIAEAVRPVGFEALEICRIEAGIPRYGLDITEKNLPQETGQADAISFTKGCYIGQEVVERIRSRGHVNRQLVGLLLEGKQDIPEHAPVFAGGQQVGTVTSSTYSFGLRRSIALGYVRREHAQTGKSVDVGAVPAEIVPLPFFATWQGPNPGSPPA